MRLLIAIPVYNEQKYVDSVLNRVKTFHPDILVTDASPADSAAMAEATASTSASRSRSASTSAREMTSTSG